MKKIVAIVLTFAMLFSTFTIMRSGVEAKTAKGYYFAMIQKKKSFFGYIKKAKIVADKKVVRVNSDIKLQVPLSEEETTTEEPTTEQPTTEQPTTAAQPATQPQTKIVYGNGPAKLITYGSFMYRKTDKGASRIIKAKKRTFTISKKCKFYDRCWMYGKKKKKIGKAKAFAKFNKIKKTSLNECELVVKNGKVVVIKFGRG